MNKVKTVEVASTATYEHFTRIADSYRYFRTTDSEPVAFIARKLKGSDIVEAADVGCGEGRYDLLLFRYLGDKLRLACVDPNKSMLETLDACMKEYGISNFITINSGAESLPFTSGALDCVFAFNSIQHFNLPDFLQESARILKSDGYLFVYIRLREQNKRNIWGLHFPKFYRKETRLPSLEAFVRTVEAEPALWVESIQFFKYRRVATLEQLVERARAHHYSTFMLYSPEELEKTIAGFAKNVKRHFKDVQRVVWLDEYALFTVRR